MRSILPALALALALLPTRATAQDPGATVVDFDQKRGGTENMTRLAHVENNPGAWKAADIELEQDRDRPYVYVSGFVNYNFFIYDLTNPSASRELFQWTIEDPDLHRGIGAMDGKYFKTGGRYYYVQSFQFNPGSPDGDLGAVVFEPVPRVPELGYLRWSARLWSLVTSRFLNYQNRLRSPEFIQLFGAAGLRSTITELRLTPENLAYARANYAGDPRFGITRHFQ